MDHAREEQKENNPEITVAASKEQIPAISRFIEDLMASSGFVPRKRFEVLLAVEELCTNIAMYAYPEGDGSIEIAAKVSNDHLELAIADNGKPFDPTAKKIAISTADVEHRPIGGLGIALARASVDGLSYEFRDGKNILRLVKNRI